MTQVPYELGNGSAAQVAEVTSWPWQQEGGDWVKRGNCPRCGHPISKRLIRTVVPLRQPGLADDAPQADQWVETRALDSGRAMLRPDLPNTVDVMCNCNVRHADGEHGCGFVANKVSGP